MSVDIEQLVATATHTSNQELKTLTLMMGDTKTLNPLVTLLITYAKMGNKRLYENEFESLTAAYDIAMKGKSKQPNPFQKIKDIADKVYVTEGLPSYIASQLKMAKDLAKVGDSRDKIQQALDQYETTSKELNKLTQKKDKTYKTEINKVWESYQRRMN